MNCLIAAGLYQKGLWGRSVLFHEKMLFWGQKDDAKVALGRIFHGFMTNIFHA